MFYKKNTEKSLSPELFKNPTSEYRGTPFWAWNCELDKDELLRQIDIFKEMGLGGFHMHVRTGLSTPYLGEEYMGFINACVDKARENDMLAYLYDEDRWPSGSAGGIVTQNDEYRQRLLRFTTVPYKKERKNDIFFVENTTVRTEEGILLTVFDIELDDNTIRINCVNSENAYNLLSSVIYKREQRKKALLKQEQEEQKENSALLALVQK